MHTKILGLTATLLSSAALLTLSAGCSSAQSSPTRMTHTRHDATVAASRHETRSYVRQNRSDRRDEQRTVHSTAADSQIRSDSSSPANDQQTAPAADPMATTAASQNDRVTVVSADQPPLLKIETPSRTISEDEFWVGGHWIVASSGFSWQEGRIESDRPGKLFAPAGWAASPRGWEFTPEYWR